jgi:hypothetical protein
MLDLKFVNWALLVDIEEAEALTAINTVEKRVMILGSLISCITFLYIYLVNRKKNQQIIADSLAEESKT